MSIADGLSVSVSLSLSLSLAPLSLAHWHITRDGEKQCSTSIKKAGRIRQGLQHCIGSCLSSGHSMHAL